MAASSQKSALIAAPGYRFLAASALLPLLAWLLHWGWLWWLGLAGFLFFSYFFRDPERPIPPGPEVMVSPADGKVILTDEVPQAPYLNGPARRIAVFMNLFDVHVNRAPAAGAVTLARHREGCFKAAFREDACTLNEQLALVLEEDGRRLLVVQIAGLLARRIVSYVQEGQRLEKGERLGMICFGSRVDLYLPPTAQILVKAGDRVRAGSSIVARWS